MVVKRAVIRKVVKHPTFRNVVRFGVKLVLTDKVLKNHRHLRRVVKYI